METTKMFIKLPDSLGEEIEAEVQYTIENDGIGAYEYWGAMCFDSGVYYSEVDDILPIFTDQSDSRKELILKHIKDNFDELSETLSEEIEIEESSI